MSRVRVHTVDQPDSDITTFVLSCNRLDLLDKTIQSFISTRDQVTKMVIVDDSAESGVYDELVSRYGHFSDVICFPTNRMQWWAMDFMVSYCDTKYIFYLEDDWELLKPGYLGLSKQILEKYRDIGTVDISWRTFENEGIDSYDKNLIDGTFYYKKFWRISDYHYQWYGWCGSPNLKRREDLILLGRVEKYYQEIWIDRKFHGLGFKAVYVNDKYVEHLGDNRSRAAAFRHNEHLTPEDKYPTELQANRVYPRFDYLQWDRHWRHPHDITLVTALVDIDRHDRNFFEHYIKGLTELLKTRHRIVVFCDPKYFEELNRLRGNEPIRLIPYSIDQFDRLPEFQRIQNIIQKDEWVNQSEWMKSSVIRSKYYIPLTLQKQRLLQLASVVFNSSYYYWIDAGIYNSFGIDQPLNNFYFTKIPKSHFFMTAFQYHTNSEIHGMNINKIESMCGKRPDYVCRASLFGGTKAQIDEIADLFYDQLNTCLNNDAIGAEEAIYTMLTLTHPEKFYIHHMPTGDIYRNYIMKLK